MAKGIAGLSFTQTSDDLTAGWVGEAEKRIAAFREGTMACGRRTARDDGPEGSIRKMKLRFLSPALIGLTEAAESYGEPDNCPPADYRPVYYSLERGRARK